MNKKLTSKGKRHGWRRNRTIKNGSFIRISITGKMGVERRFLKYWWKKVHYE